MNVIGILGSPRRDANTTIVVREILDAARAAGAATEEFLLNEMSFKGCQACDLCKKSLDHCPVNDDLAPLRWASTSVWPSKWWPAECIAPLLSGAVTITAILPARASSTALATY